MKWLIASFMICMGLIGFGKGIPYDCEIEYLESTGTQWIDTGIEPNVSNIVTTQFMLLSNYIGYTYHVLGVGHDGGGIYSQGLCCNLGMITWWNGDVFVSSGISVSSGTVYSVIMNQSSICVNGTIINKNQSTTQTGSTYLFARHQFSSSGSGNAEGFVKARFYFYNEINSNNVLIDLIPVRKGNIGYMYDRISGQLFGNDGTGAFILGPDKPLVKIAMGEFKPTAKSYVQDGLVAMWDGIENAGWGVHDQNATVWKNLVGEEDIEFNQSVDYDIDEDSVLFHDNDKAGRRAYSKMAITMTNDMTIEGMMLVPNVSLIWDFRMCIGLLNDQKTGIFPFARGLDNHVPGLKYTASYNDGTDRYFGPATKGETTSSTVVFRREDKSFDGYYNGALVSSIGSQEDNWLGDNLILNPTFLYKQLSGSMIGSDIRVHYMRIYSRVLTTEEISRNYQIDKMRFGL